MVGSGNGDMVMLVVVAVAVGGVDASNEIEWCIAICLHFR